MQKSKSKALAKTPKQQVATRTRNYNIQSPAQMVQMATVLKSHIVLHKLYTNIRGKNYVHVEGWQFAGGMVGLFPRVLAVENLSTEKEIKWKADVEIVNLKTGDIISRGFAICSKSENKKKDFDEYAVLSMAQTRAIGKAYRNIIGWVMKLAGYEGTPQEEMVKAGADVQEEKAEVKPVDGDACTGAVKKNGCPGGLVVTKAAATYSTKIYQRVLCRTCQSEVKSKK